MSKLEDALTKLQIRGYEGNRAVARRGAGVNVLDDVRESTLPRCYGGRRLAVDVDKLRAQGMIGQSSEEQRLADQYRSIKRPLLKNASAKREPLMPRRNLWMVTSAVAGEGKTFTCLNLCLSIAREKDVSVVLVDGDCDKPRLTRLFGATEELGFMDVLRDSDMSFDSAVMPTNIPGLSLLPAGQRDEHASELLASERMESLCEELAAADPQRIILFDAPPLLLTAAAPVLATHVGQIVLVVRANQTPQQSVLDACNRLDPSVATFLLLNQADARESATAYGDYQGFTE